MATEVKDLVTMYFERENAMQTLWQIYVAIVIGLLAFLGAVPSAVKRLYLPIILTVGFVGFAAVNGDAIYDVARTRNMLRNATLGVKTDAEPEKALIKLVKEVKSPDICLTTGFCILADAGVLVALWGYVVIQRRKCSES